MNVAQLASQELINFRFLDSALILNIHLGNVKSKFTANGKEWQTIIIVMTFFILIHVPCIFIILYYEQQKHSYN